MTGTRRGVGLVAEAVESVMRGWGFGVVGIRLERGCDSTLELGLAGKAWAARHGDYVRNMGKTHKERTDLR